MDAIINSFPAVLLILMLTAVGFVFGRVGWMKKEHKPLLVKLIINVAVPAMCIVNVFTEFGENSGNAFLMILIPFLSISAMLVLAIIAAKLLRLDGKRRGIFIVMASLSNSLFIGLPMCRELFGQAAVEYVMFFYIVNTSVFWTLGSALIQRSGESGAAKPGFAKTLKKIATPPLVVLVLSIIVSALQIKPPEFVLSFCSYLGNTVTPLTLLYVGYLLYETGLRNLKVDRGMIVALIMRFIVSPATAILLCMAFGFAGLGKSVFTIEAAMPVMTQAVVVASAYGADEEYIATGMSLSTLACFVTIPILMFVLSIIG